jgi:regulator of sigma E protease
MNKKHINPFLIKFIKFFLYFYILIIIHESGHLIMALIFNFTVLEFSIGLFSFFSFKLFNINFLFGLIPLNGYTSYLSNLI